VRFVAQTSHELQLQHFTAAKREPGARGGAKLQPKGKFSKLSLDKTMASVKNMLTRTTNSKGAEVYFSLGAFLFAGSEVSEMLAAASSRHRVQYMKYQQRPARRTTKDLTPRRRKHHEARRTSHHQ